jgi:hypothetical protein
MWSTTSFNAGKMEKKEAQDKVYHMFYSYVEPSVLLILLTGMAGRCPCS